MLTPSPKSRASPALPMGLPALIRGRPRSAPTMPSSEPFTGDERILGGWLVWHLLHGGTGCWGQEWRADSVLLQGRGPAVTASAIKEKFSFIFSTFFFFFFLLIVFIFSKTRKLSWNLKALGCTERRRAGEQQPARERNQSVVGLQAHGVTPHPTCPLLPVPQHSIFWKSRHCRASRSG